MSVTRGTRHESHKGASILVEIGPGDPGFVVIDPPFGEFEQGVSPDEIIVRAYQDCSIVLGKEDVFGTRGEQLAAGESIILTREKEGQKTTCQFIPRGDLLAAADAKPPGGPIHTIPPLVG